MSLTRRFRWLVETLFPAIRHARIAREFQEAIDSGRWERRQIRAGSAAWKDKLSEPGP